MIILSMIEKKDPTEHKELKKININNIVLLRLWAIMSLNYVELFYEIKIMFSKFLNYEELFFLVTDFCWTYISIGKTFVNKTANFSQSK